MSNGSGGHVVAPGPRRFIIRGADARIHSDFDHTGRLDHSQSEQRSRFLRAGAVLLPILDPAFGRTARDIGHLTPFDVRPPASPLLADELVLRLEQADDRQRMRAYERGGGAPNTWASVLGGGARDYSIPLGANPLAWRGTSFVMEARTMAGDPSALGPVGYPPQTVATPDGPLPPPRRVNAQGRGSSVNRRRAPIYAEMGPGEIWTKLYHRRGGANLANNYDVALFIIAPFLMQSNLEPVRRLYVVSSASNHNFVYDLMEGAWSAFGATGSFDRASGRPFPSSRPAHRGSANVTTAGRCLLSAESMYLIDEATYRDVWIQDQMEVGYTSGPGNRAFNVVLHCKRGRPIEQFVSNDMTSAADRVAVFDAVHNGAAEQDATDFGGNIEVSPPVMAATTALTGKRAGPPVPAHPAAPHGKIILGDCHNPHRGGEGRVHDETRHFLQSQVVQPIIPVDTSWLAVGHADEIMVYVPAPSRSSSVLLMASPRTMDALLRRVKDVRVDEGRTHFHRGKFEDHFMDIGAVIAGGMSARFRQSYDEVSVETLYNGEVRRVSGRIRRRFLVPIERRLRHCTRLRDRDVVHLPVYFKHLDRSRRSQPWGDDLAVARTLDLVNLQVVGNHLMVPRPFGPRLPRERARRVLRQVFNDLGMSRRGVVLPQVMEGGRRGFHYWAWPQMHVNYLGRFFARKKRVGRRIVYLDAAERRQLIDVVNGSATRLPGVLRHAVRRKRDAILNANGGAGALPLAGNTFTRWQRLFIPEDTVDVVEAYTSTVLARLGCTVHYVDAWFYHTGEGTAHCGTNLLHEPATEATLRTAGRRPWWEAYPALVQADTTYDPLDTLH